MDDSLPFIANILLANLASMAGVVVVLCFTQPLLLVALPALAVAYRWGLQPSWTDMRASTWIDMHARALVYLHLARARADSRAACPAG